MTAALDRGWAESVCLVCDSVCESAQVGFTRQIHEEQRRGVTALLWEAEPLLFVERYPESGIVDSYGPVQWPPPCIDYWVAIDAESCEARFSVEGAGPDDDVVHLTGDGSQDGRAIGQVLSRLPRVPGPCM